MGVNAEKILKKARAQVAGALNASPEEVFFTSCGTESDATVLRGVWESRKKQGRRIITTAVGIRPSCAAVKRSQERVQT